MLTERNETVNGARRFARGFVFCVSGNDVVYSLRAKFVGKRVNASWLHGPPASALDGQCQSRGHAGQAVALCTAVFKHSLFSCTQRPIKRNLLLVPVTPASFPPPLSATTPSTLAVRGRYIESIPDYIHTYRHTNTGPIPAANLNSLAKHSVHDELKALSLPLYIVLFVLVETAAGVVSACDRRMEPPTVEASRSGESMRTFSDAGLRTPPRSDPTHHDPTHHDPTHHDPTHHDTTHHDLSSQATPPKEGTWQDDVWNEIAVVQGIQFAYLYYTEADTRNDGVVVRLHNRNDCGATVSFDMLFRPASSTDGLGEHVVEERYDLAPGERVTGENDGLFYIPFPGGENIAEVGLRGVSVQKTCS